MAILVDSSVWIDYFNGTDSPATNFLDQSLGRKSLLVGDLILVEVLQGYRRDKDFEAAKTALLRFPVVRISSPELALESAQSYRWLRRQGITIRNTVDCLIATYCIENQHRLLSPDRDFSPFEKELGLRLVSLKS